MSFTTDTVPPKAGQLALPSKGVSDPYQPPTRAAAAPASEPVAEATEGEVEGREPAAVLTHATRLTLFSPTAGTTVSLGDASEDTWGGSWKGSFVGVTVGTRGDLWTGSRGVCITAGYVPEAGLATAEKLATAAEAGSKTIAWSETVNAVLNAAYLTVNPQSTVASVTKTALTAFTVGLKTWGAVEASTGDADELESGLLHLHAGKEILISTPGSLVTGSVINNVMMGGALAEVVGGLTAEVKSPVVAEVKGGFKAGLVGIGKAEVVSREGVEVAARRGRVQVLGDRIHIGQSEEETSLLSKQLATDEVAVVANESITSRAGDDVELTVDGENEEVVARAGDSFLSVLKDELLLRSPGARVEVGTSKVRLSVMAGPTGLGATIGAARAARLAAVEAAEALKSQALASGTAYLGAIGGVAASLLKSQGHPTGVGVAGDSLKGMATSAMLTSVAANFGFNKAWKTASATYRTAVRTARKATYGVDAAASGTALSKVDVEPTGVSIAGPTIELKGESISIDATAQLKLTSAASVVIQVGGAKIEVLPAGITIDAGPGPLTVGTSAHKWTVTPAGLVAS